MRTTSVFALCLIGLGTFAACGGAQEPHTATPTPAANTAAPATTDQAQASGTANTIDVMLCDGKTKVTVPEGTSGTTIAGALMSEWIKKNPNANWAADEREAHNLQPSAD